jgi:serpin B
MKPLLLALLLSGTHLFAAESPSVAATAINAFGIDLLRQAGKPEANFLISPYSIQSALAMVYAGADGKTRDEMAKALHFPANDSELNDSFAALRKSLQELTERSSEVAKNWKRDGVIYDPETIAMANRLFGRGGFDFRPAFLAVLKDSYEAPFEAMDFAHDAASATKRINGWVEEQTRNRIRDLVPPDALGELTRLVIVNAIYLKAPWEEKFLAESTRPGPFHLAAGPVVDVPMMTAQRTFGYSKKQGFTMVAIPYQFGELQFLVLLPDKPDGLAALEQKLGASLLASGASLPGEEVCLSLPKFNLEPPLFRLSDELERLGMKSAFDVPKGSANFDRMAPRRPEDYLYISEVFHKTYMNVDEKGTEAAAATAAAVSFGGIATPKQAIEVKVDRPFFFAIQHRASGACLFLGHVSDPR